MWEDAGGKMRQLYHLVDSTWNAESTIFGWQPQFGNQAQIVMTRLLPYLRSLYGATIEPQFLQGAVSMQSRKYLDKEKRWSDWQG